MRSLRPKVWIVSMKMCAIVLELLTVSLTNGVISTGDLRVSGRLERILLVPILKVHQNFVSYLKYCLHHVHVERWWDLEIPGWFALN
jgi:hypothetical protein